MPIKHSVDRNQVQRRTSAVTLPVVFSQSRHRPDSCRPYLSRPTPAQHVRVRRLPPHEQFWLVATPNAATEASHPSLLDLRRASARSRQRWLISAALFIAHTAWVGPHRQHPAPQRELVTTRSHLFCRPCSLRGGVTRVLKLPQRRTFPYKSRRHGVVLEVLREHARVHRTNLRGASPSAGGG